MVTVVIQLITAIISVSGLIAVSILYILQRREIERRDKTTDNEDFWDEVFLKDSDGK